MGADRLAPATLTQCGSWKVGHRVFGHLPVEVSASIAWNLLEGLELIIGWHKVDRNKEEAVF